MRLTALVHPVVEGEGMPLNELFVVELLPDEGIGDPQGEDPVGSGHDGDPPVRLDRSRRTSWIHLDEPAGGTFATSPQTRKGLRDMDWTEPGLQEAGPEGQDELGFSEVVAQRGRHSLHELMRESGFLRREAADPDIVRSAVRLGKSLPERVPRAAILAAQDGHRVREALGSELGQSGVQRREGFIPSDGTEAPALTRARHWPLQAVRIVEKLKPSKCL